MIEAVDLDLLSYLEGFLTENRLQKCQTVLAQRTRHLVVAIEDVYQMHNTSAVMRSCDAFGIQDLHIIEQRFGKDIDREIAMGAQKWVGIHTHPSPQECMDALRMQGYQIVATSPHATSHTLTQFDLHKKSALFFGTEKEGLSPEILDQADAFIYIPMVGFSESLNISVSAAIILQYLTQKLRESNIHWALGSQEQQAVRLLWAKNSIKDNQRIIARYYEQLSDSNTNL